MEEKTSETLRKLKIEMNEIHQEELQRVKKQLKEDKENALD